MAGVRRALKPGGRFAAIVLSSVESNPYTFLLLAIARRPFAALADPGMFALGTPEALRCAFERAGFREVAVHIVPTVRRFPSLAEAMQERRDSLPELREALSELGDAERALAWAEIEQSIRQFDGPDGVVAPAEMLVGVGTLSPGMT